MSAMYGSLIQEQTISALTQKGEPMDLKAKLVELCEDLENLPCCDTYEGQADYLIAHGVTVQDSKGVEIDLFNKWISVKERLPEPGVRVLASDEEFVGEFYINKRGQWQRYNVNDVALLMALDILWWKPLPKPPKGE